MCVGTLGVVVSRVGEGAIVEIGERTRWVSAALFPEVEPGDYVLVSALTIVDRLAGAQAPSTVSDLGAGDNREQPPASSWPPAFLTSAFAPPED